MVIYFIIDWGIVLTIYMMHALVGRKYSAKITAKIQLFCNCRTVYYDCNTTVSLRREFCSSSYLSSEILRNIQEGFLKPLE